MYYISDIIRYFINVCEKSQIIIANMQTLLFFRFFVGHGGRGGGGFFMKISGGNKVHAWPIRKTVGDKTPKETIEF